MFSLTRRALVSSSSSSIFRYTPLLLHVGIVKFWRGNRGYIVEEGTRQLASVVYDTDLIFARGSEEPNQSLALSLRVEYDMEPRFNAEGKRTDESDSPDKFEVIPHPDFCIIRQRARNVTLVGGLGLPPGPAPTFQRRDNSHDESQRRQSAVSLTSTATFPHSSSSSVSSATTPASSRIELVSRRSPSTPGREQQQQHRKLMTVFQSLPCPSNGVEGTVLSDGLYVRLTAPEHLGMADTKVPAAAASGADSPDPAGKRVRFDVDINGNVINFGTLPTDDGGLASSSLPSSSASSKGSDVSAAFFALSVAERRAAFSKVPAVCVSVTLGKRQGVCLLRNYPMCPLVFKMPTGAMLQAGAHVTVSVVETNAGKIQVFVD